MNEVLLANLFFIITGAAILAVAVFLCVALFHLIKIMRVVRAILERFESAAEMIGDDVRTIRDQVASGAFIGRIFGTLMAAMGQKKPRRRTTRTRAAADDITSEG